MSQQQQQQQRSRGRERRVDGWAVRCADVNLALSVMADGFFCMTYFAFGHQACDRPLALFLLVTSVIGLVLVLSTLLVAKMRDASGPQALLCITVCVHTAWFGVGNYWVFTSTSCSPTLYWVSFIYIVAAYTRVALTLLASLGAMWCFHGSGLEFYQALVHKGAGTYEEEANDDGIV